MNRKHWIILFPLIIFLSVFLSMTWLIGLSNGSIIQASPFKDSSGELGEAAQAGTIQVINTSGRPQPVISGNTGTPLFFGNTPWVINPGESFMSYDWGKDHYFYFGGKRYHYIGSVATSGAFYFFVVPDWTSGVSTGYRASASVSNANPASGAVVTIFGQLSKDGISVPGAEMRTTWHYATSTPTCPPNSPNCQASNITDSQGIASCCRDTGTATPGHTVMVDVEFRYSGVLVATTQTSFTPH